MNPNLAEEPTAVSRQGDLNIQQTILLSAPGRVLIKTTLVKGGKVQTTLPADRQVCKQVSCVGTNTPFGAKRPQ